MTRFLVVMAPYGAGGSVVAGVLDHLGAFSCRPHVEEKRFGLPSSYVSEGLDDLLRCQIPDPNLLFQADFGALADQLRDWVSAAVPPDVQTVVLHHPLLMLAAPALATALLPKIFLVRRAYSEIQEACSVDDCLVHDGAAAARVLYKHLISSLTASDMTYLDVDYLELLDDAEDQVKRLATFAGLDVEGRGRQQAVDMLHGLRAAR